MRWESAWPETLCGPGSTMHATRTVRAWLPGALRAIKAKVMLDAPCGDLAWMPYADLPCGYLGVDYDAEHVAKARSKGATAIVADLREDPLPACDVIFSRDYFQHLPLADCIATLGNFRKTGARYLIATCHGAGINAECQSGDFRPVNMQLEPFGLGAPIMQTDDPEGSGRIMGVYIL
jgi:hypothetical protein